jgi:predicted PurR-regulated permease PerM
VTAPDPSASAREPVARIEPAVPEPAVPVREQSATRVTGLFVLALAYTVYFASNLLLPIVLAVLASLVLQPVVKGLARLGIPTAIGGLLLVVALVGGLVYGALSLATPAAEWLERAPAASREIERKLRFVREPIARVSEATQEVEKATQVSEAAPQAVVVRPPSLLQVLLDRTQRIAAGALVALILLYFLLANPDGLLEKLVGLAPALTDKKRVVGAVRQIESDVSRYLLTVSLVNAGLGVVTTAVLYLLGMPNAPLWGVLAALSNFVPYAGALAMAFVLTAVGVLSFDEPLRMLTPALAFVSLTTLEAYVITPIVLSRRLTLSPAAVFLSVVVWSWLWGIPGALIAVPLLAAAKVVFQRIPRLAPIAQIFD